MRVWCKCENLILAAVSARSSRFWRVEYELNRVGLLIQIELGLCTLKGIVLGAATFLHFVDQFLQQLLVSIVRVFHFGHHCLGDEVSNHPDLDQNTGSATGPQISLIGNSSTPG